MLESRRAVEAAGRYLKRNPSEVGRALRTAMGLGVGVPVAGFRWLASELFDGSRVCDLAIDPVPPAIRMGASFELMRTPVRGSAELHVDAVELRRDAMRLQLRLERVSLRLTEDVGTAVAALLKSEALDLSRPATLLGNLPNRSPVLVHAQGNRIELDLMAHPRLANSATAAHVLGLLSALLAVRRVDVAPEHVDVWLRALPRGVSPAAEAVRDHVLEPGARRIRAMLSQARDSVTEPPPRSRFRRMLNAVTSSARVHGIVSPPL